MFLAILGVIIFVIALFWNSKDPAQRIMGRIGRVLGILLILGGLLWACVVQIDAGYVGVQKLFGKISNKTLQSGLHVINPMVEVIEMDARTMNYTMSGVSDESQSSTDDPIKVLTADGLEVSIDLTVLYRISPTDAPQIIKEIGTDYEGKVIRPMARTKIRDNAVYYDAVSLYSSKRDEFQNKIFSSIDKEFKQRGLILESLLVRNISLPASVKNTIEQKINAEQEAQKMQFVLQKEKQEAERKRVEAQGITDYQRIINESLTEKQLQYEQIKAFKDLAASNNAKIILMGKGSTPIILDGK